MTDDDALERNSMDLISFLPDEILHHILSFVPTHLAIKTCVLSKRWRHIWREVPCLSLICGLESPESLDLVDQTLIHYKALKLLSFHIGFRFDAVWLEFPRELTRHEFFVVDTWIDFALSHHVENLSFDFILYHYTKYIIPDIFYVNSSVKRLTLVFHNYTTLNPRSTVFWPSLKKLCLDGCNISDESAAKILSGCPFLESLTLNSCRMLERLDLSKSINLTRLEIDHRRWRFGPREIVAPHIHYLRLKTSTTEPCRLDRVSSLTQANLNLTYDWDEDVGFLRVMNLNLLPNLHNVEKLTLGSNFLQVLTIIELRGVSFPMFKITALTLETDIIRFFVPNNVELCGIPGIAKLLQNAPELKKLTLHLEKCIMEEECTYGYSYVDSQGKQRGVIGTSWEPIKHIALFIKLVLRNTKTLDTLVVHLDDKLDEEHFEELLQMVQTYPQDHNNVSIVIKHYKV